MQGGTFNRIDFAHNRLGRGGFNHLLRRDFHAAAEVGKTVEDIVLVVSPMPNENRKAIGRVIATIVGGEPMQRLPPYHQRTGNSLGEQSG